uniref:Uncharacterized protein n=1 Tax=Rhizophora mucronata TaxID=61149 RepID=A0A2P2P5N0_RHIMU
MQILIVTFGIITVMEGMRISCYSFLPLCSYFFGR